jgi:hypothetical protein
MGLLQHSEFPSSFSSSVGGNSAIVHDFPNLFEDFTEQQFTLLWWGDRDGFGAGDLRSCCDAHPHTLTGILDRDGKTFGGFTPVERESRKPSSFRDCGNCFKADPPSGNTRYGGLSIPQLPSKDIPNEPDDVEIRFDCGSQSSVISIS